MSRKTETVAFRVTADESSQLRRLADKEDRSVSAFLRRILLKILRRA